LSEERKVSIFSENSNFNKKDIWLFESMNIDYNDDFTTQLRLVEKLKNELKITSWNTDTLVLKIQGMVPYLFINLKSLDSNSLTISNLMLTKYTPVDTLISYSVKYKNDSTLGGKSAKTETTIPNNSLKFEDSEIIVNINKVPYKVEIVKSRIDEQAWYCTPGKAAYSYDTKGVQIFYQIKLQPTTNKAH